MRTLYFSACLLAVALFTTPCEAQTLYGTTASNSPGQLITINPATGATVLTIGPTNDSVGTNYGITGLAYNPVNGLLYGSTANGSSYAAATRAQLVTVNPATALVTVIGAYNVGNTGTPSTMADLSFRSDGALFGIGSNGGPNLYSINITTGHATVIGNSGLTSTSDGGLAISSTGTFFSTPTASRFGTFDPTTGVYTNIGTPTFPAGGGAYAALSFNGTGTLYGVNSGPGTPPVTHIATFNTLTRAVTDIGASINALDTIAFVPVPEPGIVLLVGVGAMGVARMIRRRVGLAVA